MADVDLNALRKECSLQRKAKQEARKKELDTYMKVKPKVKPIKPIVKSKREICRERIKENETIFMRKFLFSRGYQDWHQYICLACSSYCGGEAELFNFCPFCGRKSIGIEDDDNG